MSYNLPSATFLNDKNALCIIDALNEYMPDSTRFVGGCVRDAILGRHTNDIDITTKITPDKVSKILENNKISHVPTGIEHGTISAIINKKSYEITTLRKDVETDGRRAVVEFTKNWLDDAMRRDFTINALYADLNGKVYDPTNQGLTDIKGKIIRFVGDAETRIREDYLRILRFYRFYAQLDGFGLDDIGHSECVNLKLGIRTLSRERIWSEIKKIFGATNPKDALLKMASDGIFTEIFPFTPNISAIDNAIEKGDYLNRIMAIMPKDLETIKTLSTQLRFSNSEKNRLMDWAKFNGVIGENNYKSNIYYHSKQTVFDTYLLQSNMNELLDKINSFTPPKLPINGDDLHSLGYKSGQELGITLKALEKIWVDSDFTLGRTELINKAQK